MEPQRCTDDAQQLEDSLKDFLRSMVGELRAKLNHFDQIRAQSLKELKEEVLTFKQKHEELRNKLLGVDGGNCKASQGATLGVGDHGCNEVKMPIIPDNQPMSHNSHATVKESERLSSTRIDERGFNGLHSWNQTKYGKSLKCSKDMLFSIESQENGKDMDDEEVMSDEDKFQFTIHAASGTSSEEDTAMQATWQFGRNSSHEVIELGEQDILNLLPSGWDSCFKLVKDLQESDSKAQKNWEEISSKICPQIPLLTAVKNHVSAPHSMLLWEATTYRIDVVHGDTEDPDLLQSFGDAPLNSSNLEDKVYFEGEGLMHGMQRMERIGIG